MRFLDDWKKTDVQKKQAGGQRTPLPAAQKMPLTPPLLLTKSGVVMTDGKGGGRIITPQAGHNTASAAPAVSAVPTMPIVPALPAKSAAQAAGSAGRTATPQKSEAQRRVDNLPNIHAFGAGDYTGAAGLMEKAYKTARGAVKGIGSSYANIGGSAVEGMGNLQEIMQKGENDKKIQQMKDNKAFYEQALKTGVNPRTGKRLTVDQKSRYYKILNTQYTDGKIAQMENVYKDATASQKARTMETANDAFAASDRLKASADKDVAAAKEGSGKVGQFLVDLGYTGTQLLADTAANAIAPGAGMVSMASRVYGDASAEARREGKTAGQQALSGLKGATIEVLTEKLFGGLAKAYGAGTADEFVEKVADKLTQTEAGQRAAVWLINSGGEGLEEVVSDVLNPLADRLLKLDDGRGPIFTTDDAAQMGYDFLLGAAMGLVGGTGQLNRGVKQGKAQTAENAYYENLQKNGLFGGNSGQLAQRTIDAMGRAMPGEYAKLPRLVDANGMDAQQRTAWLGALEQMPQAQRNQFETAAQIAKRFGAAVQARTMQEGVQGSYQNGVIYIDPAAVDPVRQVLIHELTHHMETSGLYGKFTDAALRFVAEDMGADVDALRRTVIEDYAKAGVALDEDGATRELVAKFAEEKLFTDEATVRRLLAQDRNLFQRIYDWLRDTAAKLTGTPEQRRLIDAQNLYEKALRQAAAGTQGSGTQYDIRKLEDGRRYVQADRQVIFGNDPESWSVQLEDYINGKIRRGQDVQLIAEDGDILTLTKDSAGKLADNHTGDGRTMSESAFERKVNAAAHIDELAQISMRGKKNTPDYNARHGAMAADGWNYRTAYFRDFDGRYYMVTISTALNPEGTIIYNVGHMKEEAFPKIKGSYAENGNGPRGNASTNSISTGGGNVNSNNLSDRKSAQLAVIEQSNPFNAELGAHTWIRGTEDILTYREAIDNFGGVDDVTPDFRAGDVQRALDSGYMTVYSSYPITHGTFVTPSYMEAQNYAGDGHVYSKRVPLDDVAWLDEVQGQYTGHVGREQLSAGRSIEEMAGRHLSDEDIAWQENQERAQAARRKAAIDRMAGWTPPPPRRGEGAAVAAEVERRNAQGMPRTVNVPPVDTWGATFDSRAEARRRSYAEAISDLTTQQVSRDAEDMRNGTGSYAYRYYESPDNIGVDEGAEAADRIYAEMVRKSGHNPYTGTDIAEELAEASRETMRKKSMGERLAGAVDTLDGLEDAVRADSELRQMRREAREVEGLKMPETLRKIGVEPFGSEADYLGAEDLAQQASENERARRRTKKEAAKIPASEKEKLFARQLAEGAISWDDVPQTVNRSTVDVLADYYRVMDTETESRLLRDRRDLIFQREEAKMPALLGMDVRYDEGGLRENGTPSGKVAQQVSTLRRNLQTPARVCTTEWGREHGKRVYETLFQPVTENNGRQIDWVNSMLDRVRTFKGKDGKARELNRAERDLVQRLVESRAAGDRVQQQGEQYAEAKQNMDAAKGITVEQYLQDKGVLQEEKEQAIRDAYAEYSGKKKRGELKNTTYAAYMAEAVPGYAEYQKAKDEARKELYEKVIVGEITSRSAEARLQEAINGGERAIRYFERLGVDWHKYEEANYSQEAIFRRGTGADSKTQEYRGAAKAWSAAKKNGPFLRAAENVRNGWSAADAAKEIGIDKSQQEYRDLENYAAYLEAKKRAESDTGVDPTVVDEAVKAYSGLYKELYDGINTFLAAHGYKPIGFIEGYAPHMQPETAKTAFSKALKMLGLDDTAMMLPTSVSGMTADLKPYKQYDPFFQTRHGDKTEYDIVKGFENYVYYLGNIFYHTDDIMRIRTAAKYIRKTYTSEEASEQISWAENARNFDDAGIEDFLRFDGIIKKGTKLGAGEARAMLNDYIDGLYEQIGDVSRYSEMVKYLDNYANRLAGKQNMLDRGAEAAAGRRSLNWVNSLLGKYGGAKLAFNVSSALNQTSQLPMVMVENGEITTAKAIRDFFTKSRSDFVQHSNFLKGKKGVDWILGPETGWEKFKETGFSMTEAVDSFTSYVAVRSKYLKEKRLGASDAEAMKAADEYGRNVMGSRARGEKPMLFDTKNPFWQIATRFQLEAMNSWEHITRDLPAEIRQTASEKGKMAATGQLAGRAVRYTLYAFLINCGIGALSGGSPVPYDILGATAEAVGAAMGLTGSEAVKTLLDNVLQAVFDKRLLGTDEPEDDEEKDWWAALGSLFGNAANDVPILGRAAALAGIGDQTLPTADFSKVGDLVNSARNNGILSTDTLDKALTAGGEFLYGGNQLRKTVQGGMAAAQGGVYSGGKLRYQVDRSPWNVGRAVLFGRGALDETEEYYARQAKQFSEKQTTAWEKLQETGEPDKTAREQRQLARKGYDLIQKLRSIEKEDDNDNRAAMQRQALREADVSEDVKAVVWYETMASEKDQKTMDALKGADMGEVASVMMDMKDSKKAGEKLRIIMSSSLTDDQKGTLYLQTLAGDEDKEKVAVLKDAGMDAYQYLAYKTAISGLSGRTEKLYAIHTMDLSDYQKDALYYMNGWSKKTHDKAPWVQGVSTEAAANRLAMAVIDRESQPEEEPEWKQSLASFLGTGSSGNPFLRAMQASSNPFLRATQAEQNNPFLRAMQASGYTSADMSENPFVRALQKREAAQTAQVENPFVRALQRRG